MILLPINDAFAKSDAHPKKTVGCCFVAKQTHTQTHTRVDLARFCRRSRSCIIRASRFKISVVFPPQKRDETRREECVRLVCAYSRQGNPLVLAACLPALPVLPYPAPLPSPGYPIEAIPFAKQPPPTPWARIALRSLGFVFHPNGIRCQSVLHPRPPIDTAHPTPLFPLGLSRQQPPPAAAAGHAVKAQKRVKSLEPPPECGLRWQQA